MKLPDETFEQKLERLMGQARRLSPAQTESGLRRIGERLHGELAVKAFQESFENVAVRPAWRVPRIGVVLALAALVIVIGISVQFFKALLLPDNVYAIVEAAEGGIYRVTGGVTRSVSVGERIDTETPLRTDAGATAILKLSDGGRIEMQENSEVSLERANDGVRIRLNNGTVRVTPTKQSGRNLYLQNKEVTVPVLAACPSNQGWTEADCLK